MNPPHRLLLILIGAVLAGFLKTAGAQVPSAPQPGITVGQGWTRITAKRGAAAPGFFTIRNHSNAPDRLTSVTCPVARKTVIVGNNGKPVSGIQIQPGQVISLRPSSTHLMLRNTHFRFYPHAVIPCSAIFENSGTTILYLQVESAGAKAFQPPGSH